MFTIYCPSHQARVLLGSRAVEALVSTAEGVDLHWRCRCGTRGTLHTGRPSAATADTTHAATAA